MDYGIYEPFYEKLCIHIPSVCREGELFQFVLPVKSAGWDDIRDGGMYQSMDCIPLTEDAFFHDSDLCFTSVYTSYLRYLSAIVSGEDEKKVALCLQAMETDYVEVYAGEHMYKKPYMNLDGDLKTDIADWKNKKEDVFRESFCYEKDVFFTDRKGTAKKEQYSYEVSVRGWGCYDICRGSWYNEEVLYLQHSLFDMGVFFVPLKLVPVRMLLVHNLKINMQIRYPITFARAEGFSIPRKQPTSILGITSKIISV